MRGPDVASHQGTVDWQAVVVDGCGFGFTKATGGAWYVTGTFERNWSEMRRVGLPRGCYHYAFESSGQPYPGPGPEAEADFFLEHVLPLGISSGDMLVLDIEEGPSNLDLADWALTWLRHVESRVGFAPLCYTGAWFADPHGFGRLPALAHYPLWLAAYQNEQPEPPAPWPLVAFWQFTDQAEVTGIPGRCDLNALCPEAGAIALYGCPPGGLVAQPAPPVVAKPPAALPEYDPTYPAFAQNDDWSCAPTSTRWGLHAWGRRPSEQWLEQSMLDAGVVSRAWGLSDASGAGLAAWLNAEYGDSGFLAENDPHVLFEDVAQEAEQRLHPLMMGGRSWGAGGHWTGVRGFEGGRLLLANPASGYAGVTQTMSREQFGYCGPFSLVRLMHPSAETGAPGVPPVEPPAPPSDFVVGSGLVDAMLANDDAPASDEVFIKAGARDAWSEAFGQSGARYVWLPSVGRVERFDPE